MNETLTWPKHDLGFEELLPELERDGAYDSNRAEPGVLTCHKICQKTPPLAGEDEWQEVIGNRERLEEYTKGS